MSEYFEGENTRPPRDFQAWDKIGDKVTGVYIGKVKNDTVDQYGKKKMEYIFKTKEGYKFVSGRALQKGHVAGVDYHVLFPMLDAKPGTVMGLKYVEDKDSSKGNPIKIIDAIYPDTPAFEPEAIDEFNEKMGMFYNLETGEQKGGEDDAEVEVSVDDIPFDSDKPADEQ